MAILITYPPTNYLVSEDWLEKVLTVDNTGDAGTPNVLIDSNSDGKLSDDWLYVTDKKVTTGSYTGSYIVKVQYNKTLDPSLLNLYHSDSNSKIINLDNNGNIPLNLIKSTSTGGTRDVFVKTNTDGKVDDSLINTTQDVLANTIIKTDTDGYIRRSLLDITRIIRVLKSNVAANANYTINNTTQNANANTSETLKVPTDRKDLYVFHNGSLLLENTDYTVNSTGTFTFANGLNNGDVIQIIAMN